MLTCNVQAAQKVLQAVPGLATSFTHLDAGFDYFQKTGTALPQATLDALRGEVDCALFGAVSSPSHKVEGYSSPIVKLRKELGLFANIRPVQGTWQGKTVDLVVVRENTECLVHFHFPILSLSCSCVHLVWLISRSVVWRRLLLGGLRLITVRQRRKKHHRCPGERHCRSHPPHNKRRLPPYRLHSLQPRLPAPKKFRRNRHRRP